MKTHIDSLSSTNREKGSENTRIKTGMFFLSVLIAVLAVMMLSASASEESPFEGMRWLICYFLLPVPLIVLSRYHIVQRHIDLVTFAKLFSALTTAPFCISHALFGVYPMNQAEIRPKSLEMASFERI